MGKTSLRYYGPWKFDAEVVESDKLRGQEDLEKLYAAVIADDMPAPRGPGMQYEQEFVNMTNDVCWCRVCQYPHSHYYCALAQ